MTNYISYFMNTIPASYPRINSTWSDALPFYILLDHFANILLRGIYIHVHEGYELLFSFLECLCLLLILGKCGPDKTIWKIFSLFSFSERVCGELLLFFSLKYLVEFTNKMIWALLWVFFIGNFINTNPTVLINIELFMLSVFFLSKSLSFVECVGFFCFQIYWHNTVQISLFIFLMSVKSA